MHSVPSLRWGPAWVSIVCASREEMGPKRPRVPWCAARHAADALRCCVLKLNTLESREKKARLRQGESCPSLHQAYETCQNDTLAKDHRYVAQELPRPRYSSSRQLSVRHIHDQKTQHAEGLGLREHGVERAPAAMTPHDDECPSPIRFTNSFVFLSSLMKWRESRKPCGIRAVNEAPRPSKATYAHVDGAHPECPWIPSLEVLGNPWSDSRDKIRVRLG